MNTREKLEREKEQGRARSARWRNKHSEKYRNYMRDYKKTKLSEEKEKEIWNLYQRLWRRKKKLLNLFAEHLGVSVNIIINKEEKIVRTTDVMMISPDFIEVLKKNGFSFNPKIGIPFYKE